MNRLTHKKLLLASAAVAVMGLGASQPAMAFDDVNWTWDQTVTEDVNLDVNAVIDATPDGIVDMEKLQVQIGDVTATSTVTNFTNNPPGESAEGGPAPGPVTYVIDLKARYDDNQAGNPITSAELLNDDETGLSMANPEGHVDNNHEKIYLTFDLTVPETEPAPGPIPVGERDAIDLPHVESVATAVGNNQQIDTATALSLHDAQFLVGGITDSEGALDDVFGSSEEPGNMHSNAASAFIAAIESGSVTPASITADSTVTGILNASVSSDATAVGNNMSVNISSETPSEAFMIADITQFSYANASATSLVDDVTVEGYTGLGAAGFGLGEDQTPILSSRATAVGNNMSISVSAPAL